MKTKGPLLLMTAATLVFGQNSGSANADKTKIARGQKKHSKRAHSNALENPMDPKGPTNPRNPVPPRTPINPNTPAGPQAPPRPPSAVPQ